MSRMLHHYLGVAKGIPLWFWIPAGLVVVFIVAAALTEGASAVIAFLLGWITDDTSKVEEVASSYSLPATALVFVFLLLKGSYERFEAADDARVKAEKEAEDLRGEMNSRRRLQLARNRLGVFADSGQSILDHQYRNMFTTEQIKKKAADWMRDANDGIRDLLRRGYPSDFMNLDLEIDNLESDPSGPGLRVDALRLLRRQVPLLRKWAKEITPDDLNDQEMHS